MSSEEHYKELLKNENLKCTRHRNAVMEALDRSNTPLTAEKLFLDLKENGTSISLSTVYRVLDTLVEKDLVSRCNLPDENKAVYELAHNQHLHHLLCVKCRKVLPVDGCPLEEYEKLLEKRFGFTVKGHKLEIYGYCESCRQKLHNKDE